MKLIIKFEEDELEDAIQLSLETGVTVQTYVKAAIKFFSTLRKHEVEGNAVGCGNSETFPRFNKVVSPKMFLEAEREK